MNKFITRGVSSEIPLYLQLFMWERRAELKERDYLQIFNLRISENSEQIIEHIQEQPEFKQVYTIAIKEPIKSKVYIIDDETHVTMLLAEEY